MPKPRKIEWTNADGSKTVRWQVRYRDRAGRRRARQFDRKAEATEFGDTIKAELRAGTYSPGTLTIGQAAAIWLAACKAGRDGREPVEPTTLRQYEQHVRLHIVPFLGATRIGTLSPQAVRRFRDDDLLPTRSRAMVKKVLGSLSALCAEARSRGELASNPCDGVTIARGHRHKVEVVIPAKADVCRILDVAAGWIVNTDPAHPRPRALSRHQALWFSTLLTFIVSTGVRLSEARGAAIADLDLDRAVYTVRGRADDAGRIGPPKSASGTRALELGQGAVEALTRWLKVAPRGPHLFAGADGTIVRMQQIYRAFWLPLLVQCGFARKVAKEGGGQGKKGFEHETAFSIHDLRHFHASLQIEGGLQAKELQAHIGHASIQMTMDVYGHLFDDAAAVSRRRALVVGAVDGLLGN